MSDNNQVKEHGFSISMWILVIIMAVGKLYGGWAISWWIVFSPIWVPLAFVFTVMMGVFGIAFILIIIAAIAMLIDVIRN